MRSTKFFTLIFILLAGTLSAKEHPVKASLVSYSKGFMPGQALTVSLRLEQAPGWHTYWRDPGDAGMPTEFQWTLPAGVSAGPVLWPRPMTFKDGSGMVGYGYAKQALLLTVLQVPEDYESSQLTLKAQASWLVCREVCIPGNAGVSLELLRVESGELSTHAPLFKAVLATLGQDPAGYKSPKGGWSDNDPNGPQANAPVYGLGWMLVLAFVGGLLLNLMPCVLPVLSLKALSLVEQAGESRRQGLKLSAAFTAGVLICFWGLGLAVLGLKAGGSAVGWGFQFQSPGFVVFMAALILVLALNLFGVFEITLPGNATQGLSKGARRPGLAGAFGHGLVITLLATPCSAPFLGTAVGFAFTQSPVVLLAIFTSVGLGLALPFAVLGAWPAAHAWLPKPGKWMLRFKEAMGFFLLATLVWLLWVLSKLSGTDGSGAAMLFLVILAFAAWAWGHWGALHAPPAQRAWVAVALALMLGLAGAKTLPRASRMDTSIGASVVEGWSAWDLAEVEKQWKAGRVVLVDYTADWCWTCKVNEKAVLGNQMVIQALDEAKALKFRADWTRRDPAITRSLEGFDRSGVPLYVVYRPGEAAPRVLPEVLTPAIVIKALQGK